MLSLLDFPFFVFLGFLVDECIRLGMESKVSECANNSSEDRLVSKAKGSRVSSKSTGGTPSLFGTVGKSRLNMSYVVS